MTVSAVDPRPMPAAPAAAPGWRLWVAELFSTAATLALTLALADAFAPDLAVFGGQPAVRVRWLLTTAVLVATVNLLLRRRLARPAAGRPGARLGR